MQLQLSDNKAPFCTSICSPAHHAANEASIRRGAGWNNCLSGAKLLTYATLATSYVSGALARAQPAAGFASPPLLGRGFHRPLPALGETSLSQSAGGPLPTRHLLGTEAPAKAAYQAKVIAETDALRGNRYYISHSNKSFLGPWTEERFFNFWQQRQPQTEPIYLPIGWTGSELINRAEWKKVNNWALSFYLNQLDRQYSYFTLIQIAKGFDNNLKLSVDVHEDLRLTVFATGPTRGTRIVPLPLLKEVLTPVGLEKNVSVSFTGFIRAHKARERLRDLY
ncbi:MAG: hypothetical protein EOO40_03835, partial [Deltaproteobacteria bacterium]